MILSMQLKYTDFLHKPIYRSVYRTIGFSAHRFGRLYFMVKRFYTFLCIVVQVHNYFHISLQETR